MMQTRSRVVLKKVLVQKEKKVRKDQSPTLQLTKGGTRKLKLQPVLEKRKRPTQSPNKMPT